MNRATAIFHAVAVGPLVNIQSDVIHNLHGRASLVSLNQRPLSSAFLHHALLLDLCIQTYRLTPLDEALLQILAGTQVTIIS